MRHTRKQNNKLAIDRMVIVSNRLPIALTRGDMGQWQVMPGPGGLVTAFSTILSERGGLWIGWPGILEKVDLNEILAMGSRDFGYTLRQVSLTKEEIKRYYFGFSNEIIWPLFHDLQTRCNFDPAYWKTYQAVNKKFAQVIAENARREDYIWIQDYHLTLVAKELRSMGWENTIGFFLHIPFPPLDIFTKLPWRMQILLALLEYDIVGFQTRRDRNNFIYCIENMLDGVRVDARKQVYKIITPKRETRIGSFPISIDFKEFAKRAKSPVVVQSARQLREVLLNQQIALGVDRLDYSKGISEKLYAFRNALERFKDLRGKITLIQIVVPSREDISQYQSLKNEIEALISEINGRFSRLGWTPVHYLYRSLERTELLAYYRAADMALITSLKDGMNLVAKEYCAANVDKSGVLILSEFTGAAVQLREDSLLVNPYDIEGVADAIYKAYSMNNDERQRRMQRLRRSVARHDVFLWVDSFLKAGSARKQMTAEV
ncbi:MAG: trehalose-6-phosphate synthase [Dehalococcoidia bacterium]|nr:MAG: trehalose-6-phosphate synthase [Dehalococcoidia bacterium]